MDISADSASAGADRSASAGRSAGSDRSRLLPTARRSCLDDLVVGSRPAELV
jgi:hypothetical protein